MERVSEFGREGRTVLFVSHDTGVVGQLCRQAIWLDEGRVRSSGDAHDVLEEYFRATVQAATRVDVPLQSDSLLEQLSLTLLDEGGEQIEAPRRDKQLTFEIAFTTRQKVMALDAAVYLTDRHGVRIVNENLSDAGETISGPPQRYRIQFILSPLLAAGDYVAGVWLGTLDDLVFDGDLLGLTILPLPRDRGESVHGAVRPSVRWRVSTERSAP